MKDTVAKILAVTGMLGLLAVSFPLLMAWINGEIGIAGTEISAAVCLVMMVAALVLGSYIPKSERGQV